jgi:endonuclease-3
MAVRKRRLPAGARGRAPIVVERLALEYGDAHTELAFANPWQLLVSVILSAQTTDVTVNAVTPILFARFSTPEALASAPQDVVEEIIHRTGFFHSKARAIIEMSQDVVLRHGGEVPPRMEDLVTLRGVGRKTANVVLNVAFGEPTIAVDTHIFRVGNRTGLAVGKTPLDVEMKLLEVVPERYLLNAHHWLILHGRYTCVARRPLCEKCIIADLCKWPGKTVNAPAQVAKA